jgi:hypothetical protein
MLPASGASSASRREPTPGRETTRRSPPNRTYRCSADRIMKKRNFLMGAAALVVLAATHWFAYNRGVQRIVDHDTHRRESMQATAPDTILRRQIDVLGVAVKFPEDFSTQDIRKWRDETEATLAVVETETLGFYKKKGDEGREKRVRETIHEARDLLSKLPK